MKRFLAIFSLLVCLSSVSTFAQEVRGIETRRVIYDGKEYTHHLSFSHSENSTKYYGWELTNRNSISVSVDISLWYSGENDGQPEKVKTQSIVMKPGEVYIFKREEHESTRVGYDITSHAPNINQYYIEYKAFKLQ